MKTEDVCKVFLAGYEDTKGHLTPKFVTTDEVLALEWAEVGNAGIDKARGHTVAAIKPRFVLYEIPMIARKKEVEEVI